VASLRLSPELGAGVDKWALSQSDKPSRSEALRRLVVIGLAKASPSDRLNAAKELSSAAVKAKK
jgi:hypothetical protein